MKKKSCFVIMPFKDPFNIYYKEIIKPTIESVNFTCLRSDEIFQPNSFIQIIWESILNADIIIAEMTNMNPNVLYELGLCHAINKTVVMITQNIDHVPADLRQINCIYYNTESPKWSELLSKSIINMIQGSKNARNPYLTPVPSIDFKKTKVSLENKIERLKKDKEKITKEKSTLQKEIKESKKIIAIIEEQNKSLVKEYTPNQTKLIKTIQEDGIDIFLYPLRNTGLIIEMIKIPRGPFIYGSKGSNIRLELPTFHLSRFAITNQLFLSFLNENDDIIENGHTWIDLNGQSPVDKCRIYFKNNLFHVESGFENYPVTYVNWYGANAFCKWAEGELPTERQWEKAARGDDGRIYPWGNNPPNEETTNFNKNGWPRDISPVPVFNYPKGRSKYGCYQMVGNIWHWTSTYYEDKDVQAVRGGSFFDFRLGKREVYRFLVHPDGPDFSQGFHFCKRYLE